MAKERAGSSAKAGDQVFFEGLVYKVVEDPNTKAGHFVAHGKRGDKRPTVSSATKHLVWVDSPEGAMEELDAEAGQWSSGASSDQPKLRKMVLSLVGANARSAAAEIGKLKGGFFYLPGRLIEPPVSRPELIGKE